MSPNEPEDQPPKVPPPRAPGVERDRLPRPPEDEPAAATPPSQLPRHWKSGLVAAVGVLALLIVLLSNSGGGPKPPVTVTVPAPSPAGATATKTEAETEPKPPPPPPEGPKKVWENETTFEEAAGYSVDKYPVEKGATSTGFEVRYKTVEAFGGAKLAAWNGHEKPSLADCVNALNASAAEPVKLETVGQWFCAESGPEYNTPTFVARFRYDSGEPPPEGHIAETGYYKFFVIVYKPGHK